MSRFFFLFDTILILFACSCNAPVKHAPDIPEANRQLIKQSKHLIHSGDVIMRSGRDFTSYRIRELSDSDKTYSHAGIALVKDSNIYIYHITPPEIDEPIADTAMRLETLEKFANPLHCFGFGIVRYRLDETEIASVLACLDSLYKKKISFDHSFDLRDASQMYCSEMVDNTFSFATHHRITLTRKYFNRIQAIKAAAYFHLPITETTKRAYISIDAVQLNANAGVVQNYVFLK